MIDNNTQAAKAFWRAVQDWVASVKPWDVAIYYDIKPDERWDVTLISERVYGRRCEFVAIMAAAGVSNVDEPMEQKQITLPNEGQLRQLKFKSGFESRPEYRENGAPTWRAN